jgi:hypothetical protein
MCNTMLDECVGTCDNIFIGNCNTSCCQVANPMRKNIQIGNCNVTVGNNDRNILLGNCNFGCAFNGLAIGEGNTANGGGAIAIGNGNATYENALAIGASNNTQRGYSTLVGYQNCHAGGGQCFTMLGQANRLHGLDCEPGGAGASLVAGFCNLLCCGTRSTLVGFCNTLCDTVGARNTQIYGNENIVYESAQDTSVFGVCNFAATGASGGVILGSNNNVTVPSAIAIGKNLSTCGCCTNNNAVLVGKNICVGNNTGSVVFIGCHYCNSTFTGCDSIAIGKVGSSQNPHCSVMIGSCINNAAQLSVVIGSGGQVLDGCKLVIIGSTHNFGVAREVVSIGDANSFSGSFPGNCRMIAIGGVNCIQEFCTQAYGYNNLLGCGATGAASLGHCNTNCFTGAIVIGNSLTSEKVNTTHVNHLIAFGQGASKYHAVGNITGTTSLNWDNGNNQSVTLTGSVILGFSNPIAGANYGISITQGGVGGYTITWSGVLWANATPPVLSAAVASVDFVNLVYDGTNYYGTYGNNFA